MKRQNQKTERLLLNTTPKERSRIQSLMVRARTSSESALVRQALDFYVMLHPNLKKGEELLMKSPGGRRSFDIHIPVTYHNDDITAAVGSTGIRHPIEVRLEPEFKKQLQVLVSDEKAAPTMTALAAVAVGAYAEYLTLKSEGMDPMIRKPNGSVASLAFPSLYFQTKSAGEFGIPLPDGCGYVQPIRVFASEVIRQESELDAEIIVIDAPFTTSERFPEMRETLAKIMKTNITQKLTEYQFIKADSKGVDEVKKYLEEYLENDISWSDFTEAQHQELDRRIASLRGNEHSTSASHPLWALVRPRLITASVQEAVAHALIGRLFDTAQWYARLKNGRFWGYKFVRVNERGTPADETLMTPLDPEAVAERFEMLDKITEVGWEDCQPVIRTKTDTSPKTATTRRKSKCSTVFRALLAAGIAALFLSCHKPASPATYTVAHCTHSIGLCNLPLFISAEEDLGKEFGVKFDLVNIPNWGDHASAITAGRVDFSVTPFTNVMTAYANGAPIKVVAGSGINGLFLIGKSELTSVADLKGKTIGTFQSDTLEMLLFSALQNANLTYKDIEVIYFTDGFEMINAFATGRVQAITHVEPYATQVVQKFGGKKLASGKDIWKGDHPDCVLTVSEKVLKQNPALVKGVIRAMLRAQLRIETDRETTVKEALGKYYKADFPDVLMAAEAQPPGVDIRSKLSFMTDRFHDLQKLNYVKPEKTLNCLIDFSLLEEVVKEDAEVMAKLKFKSDN